MSNHNQISIKHWAQITGIACLTSRMSAVRARDRPPNPTITSNDLALLVGQATPACAEKWVHVKDQKEEKSVSESLSVTSNSRCPAAAVAHA